MNKFTDEELLYDLYYKKLNFDGANILFKKARVVNKDITFEFVKDWLNKQATHQQNSNTSKRLVFLPIYSESPFGFQIDLTFFPRYKKQNDGNYVLFTAININTRYAYAYYAKSKDGDTILDIMKQFHTAAIEIDTITTDEGTEFTNEFFTDYCNENNIKTFFVKGDSHKLGIVNRFHRTLKDKLLKYMTSQDTVRWIDVIDKIVWNYNHTVNRGIGMEPYKANSFIQTEIIAEKKAQTEKIHAREPQYEINNKCRILNKTALFDDKMTSQYSNKIYTITKVNKNSVILNDTIKKKKSEILLINDDVQEMAPDVHIQAVREYNIARNKTIRAGVDEDNIIHTIRPRRNPVRFIN
jgi:hypothetical protein